MIRYRSTTFEFTKFILTGAINTLITYTIYLILIPVIPYKIAYSIGYVCGVMVSFFLNTFFVFKAKATLKKFFRFPIVYIFQYILNIVFLYITVEKFSVNKKYAPIVVIILSIPITFILSRLIIKDKPANLNSKIHKL